MKEKVIQIITPGYHHKDKLSRVDAAFVTKDFLTEADIEEMARTIADSIKEKLHILGDINQEDGIEKETEMVVYTLQASQILNYYITAYGKKLFVKSFDYDSSTTTVTWTDDNGVSQTDTITEEELEPFLQKIRIAVLNKLSGILPDKVVARIIKRNKGRVSELEEGRYYKQQGERGGPARMARENNNQTQALKNLHNLPKRSPFIYYGTESLDTQNLRTISKGVNLTNIREILMQKEKPPLSKILGYFSDVVEGHRFLLSQDLILFDNKADNLGIDKETDKGILFDFDGLRRKNDKTAYVVPLGHLPPERIGNLDLPATEANTVYELGINLELVRRIYDRGAIPAQQRVIFETLIIEMTDKDPDQRPNLEQVQKRLEIIKMAA